MRALTRSNTAEYKSLKSGNKLAEQELQERCADSIDFANSSGSVGRARNSMTTDQEEPASYKQFKSAPVTAVKAKEESASDSAPGPALLVIIALLGLILVALTGLYCLQRRRKSDGDSLRFEAPRGSTARDNAVDIVDSSARESAVGVSARSDDAETSSVESPARTRGHSRAQSFDLLNYNSASKIVDQSNAE